MAFTFFKKNKQGEQGQGVLLRPVAPTEAEKSLPAASPQESAVIQIPTELGGSAEQHAAESIPLEAKEVIKPAHSEQDTRAKIKSILKKSVPTASTDVAVSIAPKSATQKQVEDILSRGLEVVYQQLLPAEQIKFRTTGEEVARRIEQMLVQLKATAQAVLDLIRRWFGLIPHVNKFFLEQEAKLKTDQVMELQEKVRRAVRDQNIYHE